VAKRSPILGYNHNVRYRGLVFHVQTEDSGVLAPHLFTHLFHSGVIVSTRKYVYDSGSTEDAIKALMQAQHKAALKELRNGKFDDKIDRYLGGTPGLLPRGGEPADPDTPPLRGRAKKPATRGAPAAHGDADDEDLTDATVLGGEPAISREVTLEEPLALRPTEHAVEPPLLARMATMQVPPGRSTPSPGQLRAVLDEEHATSRHESAGDSQPEITIQLEAEEPDDSPLRRRLPRDTDTNPWDQTRVDLSLVSDGIPGSLAGAATIRTAGDASGPVPGTASGPITGPLSHRAAKAVGAASLPPARPISRPASRPAMVPAQVVSRPAHAEDRRTPPPEGIEVYALAPPSAELPQPPERPGQYSQHKKISTRIPSDGAPERRSHQQVTIPMRPGSSSSIPQPARPGSPPPIPQRTTPVSIPVSCPVPARTTTPQPPVQAAQPPQRATPVPMPRTSTPHQSPVRAATPPPVAQVTQPLPGRPLAAVPPLPPVAVRAPNEPRTRTPTPQRVSVSTPPGGTPGLGQGRPAQPSAGGGVVMSRPAVIVGAPPGKPASSSQRVRKAREDEGRSFGQGLISEKSLDEVILAYLSEDAEDK
jgi:hypothetical protein